MALIGHENEARDRVTRWDREQCDDGAAPADRGGERGMAMLVVLWIIASASILVASFNATARSGVQLMSAELQMSKAKAALNGGLEIAAAHLIDANEDARWLPDGKSQMVRLGDFELTIRISDPNALFDINKADPEILKRLFERASNSEDEADQIVKGILTARKVANTPAGQNAIRDRSLPDEGDFETDLPAFINVNQLRQIDGVTESIFRRVENLITVYSSAGKINPKTASDDVLAVIPELSAADISRLRRQTTAQINNALDGISEAAQSAITGDFGPAYTVTVTATNGRGFQMGNTFTIIPRLDSDAPYRLIAQTVVD